MGKGYYQNARDKDPSMFFQFRLPRDRVIGIHFHKKVEIHLLPYGNQYFILDGKKYETQPGDIVVIDSYQAHRHGPLEGVKDDPSQINAVTILSADFTKLKGSEKPLRIADPVIHDPELCEELFEFARKYFKHSNAHVQALAGEMFLGLLAERLTFVPVNERGGAELIRNVLSYIDEHFRENVTRESIAQTFGYTPTHISRVFHHFVQERISDYVNRLRLDYIEKRKRDNDATMTELIYEAGFNNQQTYYRAKKQARANENENLV